MKTWLDAWAAQMMLGGLTWAQLGAQFLDPIDLAPARFARKKRQIDISPAPLPASDPKKRKSELTRDRVLTVQKENPKLGCRKIADMHNQLFGTFGERVSKTWVNDFLRDYHHRRSQAQQAYANIVPDPKPVFRVLAMDTTTVTDESSAQHTVLGMVDEGSRWATTYKIEVLNAESVLACLLTTFGEQDWPDEIRMDNHPVFRSRAVKEFLRLLGIRRRFTKPRSPWQNGYIERFFGTFKHCLKDYPIRDEAHLNHALTEFAGWYNTARPHQNLGGRTPMQALSGVNPFRQAPQSAQRFVGWGSKLTGYVTTY